MPQVAIALGSNLGDRHAHLSHAISALGERLSALRVSPFVDTDPVGVGEQPRYLNGAVTGEWAGSARELLTLLLEIERRAGRTRPFAGAPRTLDLDLILFGADVVNERDLQVPHPRFRERAFVLEPLAAIAAGMVDPTTGLSVGELLARYQER